MTTNQKETPLTVNTTEPNDCTLLPMAYRPRLYETAQESGFPWGAWIGHNPRMEQGKAELTLRIKLPVALDDAMTQTQGLDRAEYAVEVAGEFVRALTALTRGSGAVVVTDALLLSSTDAIDREPEPKPEPLSLYTVMMVQRVPFTRMIRESGMAERELERHVLAASHTDALALAKEAIVQLGDPTWHCLTSAEQASVDWSEDCKEADTPEWADGVESELCEEDYSIAHDPAEIIHVLTDSATSILVQRRAGMTDAAEVTLALQAAECQLSQHVEAAE